jgi:hypothetical protein
VALDFDAPAKLGNGLDLGNRSFPLPNVPPTHAIAKKALKPQIPPMITPILLGPESRLEKTTAAPNPTHV